MVGKPTKPALRSSRSKRIKAVTTMAGNRKAAEDEVFNILSSLLPGSQNVKR
jgi:hypothetical protein